jgi:hypothetical protein
MIVFILTTICVALQMTLQVDHLGFEKSKYRLNYPEKLPPLSIQKNEKVNIKLELDIVPRQIVLSLRDITSTVLLFVAKGDSYSLTIVYLLY